MLNKGELVEYLYNSKLPELYRVEDTKQKPKLPLYRYLQALFSATDYELDDINGVLLLVDPEKCPDKFLPFLLESFGLTYFEDIDPKYQRRLLNNVGVLFKRRGTYNCVRFLVRALTNLDVKVHYNPDTRVLTITLLADTIESIRNLATSKKVITRYLQDFLPYYCKPTYDAVISPQRMEGVLYHGQFLYKRTDYTVLQD